MVTTVCSCVWRLKCCVELVSMKLTSCIRSGVMPERHTWEILRHDPPPQVQGIIPALQTRLGKLYLGRFDIQISTSISSFSCTTPATISTSTFSQSLPSGCIICHQHEVYRICQSPSNWRRRCFRESRKITFKVTIPSNSLCQTPWADSS